MMPKLILFLLLLTALCGCQTVELYRYTLVRSRGLKPIEVDTRYTRFIPLTDQELGSSRLLDSACALLQANRSNGLYRYLRKVEKAGSPGPDYYLIKTWEHLNNGNPEAGAGTLRLVNGPEYERLRLLLQADVDYEMARERVKSNFRVFLGRYQAIVDKSPNDTILKKVVAMRVHHIRYEE